MAFMDWLRGLFRKQDDLVPEGEPISPDGEYPPEALGAATNEELAQELGQFHESNTRNEVILRQVQRELAALEARERKQIEDVKAAEPGTFAQRMGLQEIDRMRQRKAALMQRADVYQTNIRQNNEMIHKGEMLLSMRDQGVSKEQLVRLEVDFQTEFESWRKERMGTDAALDPAKEVITEQDRKRLEEVEREILGQATLFGREGKMAKKPAPREEELRAMVESTESAKPASEAKTDEGKQVVAEGSSG